MHYDQKPCSHRLYEWANLRRTAFLRAATQASCDSKTCAHNAQKSRCKGLSSFVCVESLRTVNGSTFCERHYDISDPAGQRAQALLSYVRGHWGIENRLHWSLDVTFREDTLRNRIGHSAASFTRIRRLSLLGREKTCKASLKSKRMRADPREDYLARVLCQGI
ncbi:MAG: ISAs1 family transposase [Phycisphaerae bacterium]